MANISFVLPKSSFLTPSYSVLTIFLPTDSADEAYSLPNYFEDNIINFLMTPKPDPNAIILLAHTRFIIEQLHIEGDIILIFEVGSLNALLSGINSASEGMS